MYSNTNASTNASIPVLKHVTNDDVLIEAIYNPQTMKASFVVGKDGKFEPKETYFDSNTGRTYVPFVDNQIEKGYMVLPTAIKVPESTQDLLQKVQNFIHKYCEFPLGFEKLSAMFVLMTWGYDKFPKVPYFRALGLPGTGKTQYLITMAALCYHSLLLGTGFNAPALYRFLEDYQGGTLVLDEANFSEGPLSHIMMDILKGGYSREMGHVPRCDKSDYKQRTYISFSPKLLSTTQAYYDEALESRIISQTMKISKREEKPGNPPPILKWEEANQLRSLLLGFRMTSYHQIQPDQEISGLADEYDPRFIEILQPLFQAVGESEVQPDICEYLKIIKADRDLSKQSSLSALIATVLFDRFAHQQSSICLSDLAQRINADNRMFITSNKVGRIARGFGLTITHTNTGNAIALIEHELKELADQLSLKLN